VRSEVFVLPLFVRPPLLLLLLLVLVLHLQLLSLVVVLAFPQRRGGSPSGQRCRPVPARQVVRGAHGGGARGSSGGATHRTARQAQSSVSNVRGHQAPVHAAHALTSGFGGGERWRSRRSGSSSGEWLVVRERVRHNWRLSNRNRNSPATAETVVKALAKSRDSSAVVVAWRVAHFVLVCVWRALRGAWPQSNCSSWWQ
jgi:hypothetical protein